MAGGDAVHSEDYVIQRARYKKLVREAVDAVDKRNFAKYMNALVALGDFAYELHPDLAKRKKARFDGEEVRTEDDDDVLKRILPELEDPQLIEKVSAFQAFEEVLEDDDLKALPTEKRKLRQKNRFHHSLRRKLTLGSKMLAMTEKSKVTLAYDPRTQAVKDVKLAEKLDAKVVKAFDEYKTPRQKALYVFGIILGVLAAATFGVTLGAGVIGAALAFSLPITAIVIISALAILAAGSLTNYFIFKNPCYHFLNDVMGKDRFLEGFLDFVDENGEKKTLTTGRKAALVASIILALSVGGTTGALTFTSVLGLGSLKFLTAIGLGMFAGATVASVLFPIAIFLGVVAFVCLTALMLKAFAGILQKTNILDSIIAPFKRVWDVFDPKLPVNAAKNPKLLAFQKWLTIGILGALTLLALFGLVTTTLASAGSLNTLLLDYFLQGIANAATIAWWVSIVVGCGFALVGQIPFISESTGKAVTAVAVFFRDDVPKIPGKLAEIGKVIASPFISLVNKIRGHRPEPEETHEDKVEVRSFSQKMKDRSLAVLSFFKMCFTFVMKCINATGNGLLVYKPLFDETFLGIGGNVVFSLASTVGGGVASLMAGLGTDAGVSEQEARSLKRASDFRIQQRLLQKPPKQAEGNAMDRGWLGSVPPGSEVPLAVLPPPAPAGFKLGRFSAMMFPAPVAPAPDQLGTAFATAPAAPGDARDEDAALIEALLRSKSLVATEALRRAASH